MNVDDAIWFAELLARNEDTWGYLSEAQCAITLVAEVNRLREELEKAKSDSVPPCDIKELTQEGAFKIEFYCDDKQSTAKMLAWLMDRSVDKLSEDTLTTCFRGRA